MSLKATELLMKLMQLGMSGVHINSTLDADTVRRAMARDRAFLEPSRFIAASVARTGQPVWFYRFSYVARSLQPAPGARHASDVPYMFGTVAARYGTGNRADTVVPAPGLPVTMHSPPTSRARSAMPVIPKRILDRPPTAELKPNQKDEDSLPPYPVLDPILKAYVEEDRSIEEILAIGFARDTVAHVVGLVDRSEYKRRQAPVGIKITHRGLGKDRRMPITNGYRSL